MWRYTKKTKRGTCLAYKTKEVTPYNLCLTVCLSFLSAARFAGETRRNVVSLVTRTMDTVEFKLYNATKIQICSVLISLNTWALTTP